MTGLAPARVLIASDLHLGSGADPVTGTWAAMHINTGTWIALPATILIPAA